MNTYPFYALIVAGIMFGLVTLLHLLRIIYHWPIIIATRIVPIWVSVIGFILPLLLMIWMFTAAFHL